MALPFLLANHIEPAFHQLTQPDKGCDTTETHPLRQKDLDNGILQDCFIVHGVFLTRVLERTMT